MALFDDARHEPVTSAPWDEGQARAVVAHVVAEGAAALGRGGVPPHPRDDELGGEPRTTVYLGAMGVVAGLAALEEAGFASGVDLGAAAVTVESAWCSRPDVGSPVAPVPSLLFGESGIRLVRWMLAPDGRAADALARAVEACARHPALELMWGAPGTMCAALAMWCATGEERWRLLWRESAEALWSAWQWDARAGCHLWRQRLWGSTHRLLGACHGAAGALGALFAGADLLDEPRRGALFERAVELARATAHVQGGEANWPADPGEPPCLVQWCHGAPGLVTSLAHAPAGGDPELDGLLLAGGELVWRAGPLGKGVSLCHGTAGNGFALLKLWRRTRDPRWLARARAFGMHAIEQQRATERRHGRAWLSLWTGDVGLALFLADCLRAEPRAELPFVDGFRSPTSAAA
jgi:hypothetical protein